MVRDDLATALTAALDASVKVVAQADAATPEPGHDLVMVMLDEVTPSKWASARHTVVSVIVSVAKVTPGVADDALEAHLGAVLDALDDIAWANWTVAKRSLYAPTEDSAGFPAFTITIEIEVH